MALREARCHFTLAAAKLISMAEALGFECALDEGTVHLTPKNPTGNHKKGSVHYSGLAIDLLLYKGGVYLSETADYTALGEYWESLGVDLNLPLRWGGRFSDGNHFSHEWNGMK